MTDDECGAEIDLGRHVVTCTNAATCAECHRCADHAECFGCIPIDTPVDDLEVVDIAPWKDDRHEHDPRLDGLA